MPYFAGLDWGSTGHAVCVVDAAGTVLLRLDVAHDADGLADMRRKLDRLAPAAELPVAIERPSGLIVDALLAAGHPVVNDQSATCIRSMIAARAVASVCATPISQPVGMWVICTGQGTRPSQLCGAWMARCPMTSATTGYFIP